MCNDGVKRRINRYIMECKFDWGLRVPIRARELIDTLWNVNDYEVFNLTKKEQELIDTLWNVNIFSRPCRFWNHRELIDTLWNVNELLAVVVYVIIGINRYIMECK